MKAVRLLMQSKVNINCTLDMVVEEAATAFCQAALSCIHIPTLALGR